MENVQLEQLKKVDLTLRSLRVHDKAVSTQNWANDSRKRLRRQMHIADSLVDALNLTMVTRRSMNY